MRVLFLPRGHGVGDIHSTSLVPKQTFQHMMKMDPNLYVIWLTGLGTKQEIKDEYQASMPDPARFTFLESDVRQLPIMQTVMTQQLWDLLMQAKAVMPYDLVLNQFMGATPQIASLLYNKYDVGRYNVDVPMVNWHVFTLTRALLETMPQDFAGEGQLMAESLSSFFGEWNIWESEHLYQNHLATLKEWTNPSVLRRVMERSEVCPPGVSNAALEKTYERRMKRAAEGGRPVLFYGGRLAGVKNIRTTFPLLADAAIVLATDFVICSQTSDGDEKSKWTRDEFPGALLFTGVEKADFHRHLARGDIFFAHSEDEGYGTGWIEMLAAGMLGVFDERKWVRDLLPDWYPFVSGNPKVQLQMAVMLGKQWPDGEYWTDLVPKMRAWAAEHHDDLKSAERILTVLQEQHAAALLRDKRLAASTYGQLADAAAEKAIGDRETVPADEVYMAMRDLSDTKREWGKRGDLISQMFIRRCLEAGRWEDTCQSSRVEFRRSTGAS